jgi:PKD repeat protein
VVRTFSGPRAAHSASAGRRSRFGTVLAILIATVSMVVSGQGMAQAFGPSQPTPVSAVPSKATPNVLDGTVFAITQVGTTMVIGGSFTKAANPGGTTQVTDATNGKYILAFDAATGTVKTAFAPGLDGIVQTLQPGPTANTVYVGGLFNNVGGLKAKSLVLLDLTTGKRVTSFAVPAINGGVQSVRRVGNRLFVGGTFTSYAGQPRGGLASVNATTGVIDSFVHSTVATNHSWTPGSSGVAKAAVGVFGMDVTPDGSRMIVIGNFKTVDGLPRDQIAMFDLTGASAVVRADWATHGYEAACYSWAYDTYVRDVEFSPDGSYFVVAATGGGNGTLCDTAARFETAGSGDDVKPSWVNWAGGDSYFSVAITNAAVYIGGHQRWMNNPIGNDYPGGGAVPRPGLGALDPTNGEPLTWNPGRNPRGAGAYTLFATPSGLYVGSDTDYIGNRQYKRGKIAFFPLAGGTAVAASTTPALPGNVFLGGAPAPRVDPASVLYRVNAGGPALTATDGGPDWTGDTGSSSPYRTGNSSYIQPWDQVQSVDASVPENTPTEVFSSERWDSGSQGDGDEMRWAFPVPAGTQVSVRLYLANQCSCTASPGQRQFDVSIDGTTVLDHFDIVAATGGSYVGTMRSFPVTSDGTVNIDFTHEVENPLINGIEIVRATTGTPAPTSAALNARYYDGTTAGALTPVPSDLDWNTVRGAVLIGSQLYYGLTDSTFHRRSFDGKTFGPAQLVDPYNDPVWSNVDTGSGQTFRGTVPDLYGQMSHVTSMVFSDGRLYYTLSGSSSLYYRGFSPDSGIMGAQGFAVPGVTLPGITGAFVSGGSYWYVDGASGNLEKVAFTPGTVSSPAVLGGSPTAVSGPSMDGVDWRARSLFLGPAGKPNAAPIASASASCTGLSCTFNGSASTDPDGSVTAYSWAFGDGATASGVTASHTYAAGTYTATLTVTDDKGAVGSTTKSVTVTAANQPPTASATGSCSGLTCSFDASGSTDPDGSIASYAWTFGDGQTGTGKTVPHTYAAAGDYHATLTVTDDKGATAQQQITVSPANPGTPGVGFRGVSGTDVLASSAKVTVPTSVRAGDLLILNVGGAGAATQTPPNGWTQVAQQAPTGVLTTVWQRMATSTDAGSTVTVTFGASEKADVTLLAYFGAGAIDPLAAKTATDATSAGSHKAPDVTATKAGSYALWFWNVKSSGTTALTVPSGTVSRNAATGTGTGYITTLAAESASAVSGTVTGPTSVANGSATTGRTIMISLVIPPA